MTTEKKKKGQTKIKEKTKIKAGSFRCKFCGKTRPIEEMVVLRRFFPPLVVCRDCEKKMQ
ncbi:MAG: hypothetical protein ABIH70_08615 [Chloroflexota bacterium]